MNSVYNDVMQNLFEFEGKHLHLKIHSVVCGTHAMTFVKKTIVKSYSGYHDCDKYVHIGAWMGKMTFSEVNSAFRFGQSFSQM